MKLTITRPDDWHLHVRDGDVLPQVMPFTAQRFARAIIMPNLTPPITTTAQALAYRDRILQALPAGSRFQPLMTLYLTNNTAPAEIVTAYNSGQIHAVKLYPAGATTNSDAGVTDIKNCYRALEAMQACGMPLLVHGEVVDANVDIFDREKVFIERVLIPTLKDFPGLKVVFEHITTSDAAAFVSEGDDRIAATITPQHLLYNRNAIFQGGIRPHYYCLPILKREEHREALVRVATSGNTDASSWVPTAHPMPGTEKNPPVAAPAFFPRRWRSNFMRTSSSVMMRWTNWKPLPVSMVRIFMACRATRTALRCNDSPGPCRNIILSVMM